MSCVLVSELWGVGDDEMVLDTKIMDIIYNIFAHNFALCYASFKGEVFKNP